MTRPGGFVVFVGVTPRWTGDEEREGLPFLPEPGLEGYLERLLQPHGFEFRDFAVVADYGSVEEAVATHGFIYGEKAIDYLLDHQISRLGWVLRLYFRRV